MKFIKKQIIKENVLTESIKEAVNDTRTYDAFDVYQIVKKTLTDKLGYNVTEEQGWDIEDAFKNYTKDASDEIYAEDVDKALEVLCDKFKISPEELSIIEQEIMASNIDYAGERKSNFINDVANFEDDIKYIQHKLRDLQDNLFELENKSVMIKEKLSPILEKFNPILDELKLEIENLYNTNYTGLEK